MVTAVWWSVMLSFSVAILRTAFASRKPGQIEGHRFGDCTDEMFEAMREVDAMGLSGEPLLQARLPPRTEDQERNLRALRQLRRDQGYEIEFDPITGRTRYL